VPGAGQAAPTCAWARLKPGSNASAALRVRIRITPKSSRDAIEGLTTTPDGPAIKARVRAVPENGAANKALQTVVAKWLSVPKGSTNVSAGAKSRTKLLTIVATEAEIARIIEQLEQLSQS